MLLLPFLTKKGDQEKGNYKMRTFLRPV